MYVRIEGDVDESAFTESLLILRAQGMPFAETNRIRLLRTHIIPSFWQRWQAGRESLPSGDNQNPQNS